MARRIVGVEMDVWTKDEVEGAMRDGFRDADCGAFVPAMVQEAIMACILRRLMGERT